MEVRVRLLWLLAWWPMAGLAAPPPPSTSDAVPAGPTEVMLLFGDVNATVVVAGKETRVPANLELPVGTHEARITTSSGQLVVKVVEVRPNDGHVQVIDLGKARAAAVPGHTFRFEVTSSVEGLVIFVDGVEGGPSPLEVLLAPGEHTVELQRPDGTRTGGPMQLEPRGEGPTVISLRP